MKLFYFNPNDYGSEAFVCAESLEDAKKALINTKQELLPDLPENKDNRWNAIYHNKMIDEMIKSSGKRTIDEFEPGQVVFSDIC